MKSIRTKRFLQNFALAAMSMLLALAAVEAFVRITWKDSPADIRPSDDTIFMKSDDPREVMTLLPGASGYHSLTHFRFNSRGYRGPEYGAGRKFRIAVAGDSFIYGYALPEEHSLPGFLQRRLQADGVNAEVINAGVPAYNLEQNIAHVSRVAADYHPDAIVVSFIHNDFSNDFYANKSGIIPVLTTSDELENPRPNLAGRISSLMLPMSSVDATSFFVRFRYMLANHWRTYEYIAFRLHKIGSVYPKSGRMLTFPRTTSRQLDNLIWDRARANLRKFKALADEYHFAPMIMIFMDYNVEGRPIQRFKRVAAEEGVPVIDMTPLWGEEKNYVRRYTIAWDSHPNSVANELAARTLADYLSVRGVLPKPPTAEQKQYVADVESKVAARDAENKAAAQKQDVTEAVVRKSFGSELTPGGSPADQWLYGWWTGDPFTWDTGGGRWMSGQSAFFLKIPQSGAAGITLEGYRAPENEPAPPMRVIINCGGAPDGRLVMIKSGKFRITLPLFKKFEPGSILECELFATRVVTPLSLGKSTYDYRYISLAFTRIALY